MSEKRKHIRITRDEPIRLETGGWSVEGTATDISASGMRVVAPIEPQSAPAGRVLVSFPDLDHGVSIPVRIAHSTGGARDGSIGLQFEFDSLSQMELVDRYVRAAKERDILELGASANNRRLPRASCTIVSVQTAGRDAEILRLDNASTDGFLATYSGTLAVGDSLSLEFRFPGDERPVQADVVVVYTEENPFHRRATAGLRVVRITEIDRNRLRNFILDSSSGSTARSIHTWIAKQGLDDSYQVYDREVILRLLETASSSAALVHLIPESGNDIRTARILELDPDAGDASIHLLEGRPLGASEAKFFGSFVAGGGSYYFSGVITLASEAVVRFRIPDRLQRSEQRSYGRTGVPESAEIVLFLDGEGSREVPARLLDVSRRGFLCEMPADDELTQVLSAAQRVSYRATAALGLDTEGEIRHLRVNSGGIDGAVIRLGVETGVRRRAPRLGVLEDDEWAAIPVYNNQIPFLELPGATSRVVRYQDASGRSIAALINSVGVEPADGGPTSPEPTTPGHRPEATVFVLPPAFGKKKESLAPLAAVLMANFAHLGQPLVVLRYDGIDRPGESDNVSGNAERGYEMLHYRISGGRSDLQATLDYVDSHPQFRAARVVLVTFSMSALDGRKVLIDPANAGRVDYWVSAMGVPAAQSALRNTLGGLDVVGNFRIGIPSGVSGLLGHLVDMDRVAQDLIEHRYAYVTDARAEMAAIDVPVLWLYGRHDMWVTPAEIADVMSVEAPKDREIVEIPAGHNLRTSDDAIRTFKLIVEKSVGALFSQEIVAVDPDKFQLLELVTAERERLEQRLAPTPDSYWRNYLIGRGEPGSGYDFYRNLVAFRTFLQREVFLLDVRDNMRVADMGCGTGLFLEQLLLLHKRDAAGARSVRVTAVDLVPEAIASAREKTGAVLQGSADGAGAPDTGLNNWVVEYIQRDLEPNRLLPVRDFLADSSMPLGALRGRIQGLTGPICAELDRDDDGALAAFVRAADGRTGINGVSTHFSTLSTRTVSALRDLRQASLCLQGLTVWSECRFTTLNLGATGPTFGYGFGDGELDRLNASLFISYLFNPDYALAEFFRMLRPGGRLVISSMRPDSDISVIFTDYVAEMEVGDGTGGQSVDGSLRDAREMLNEAAELFELEEEGFFRFYDETELCDLVTAAGFVIDRVERSLGDPSQAVIVSAVRPSMADTA